MTFFNKIQWVAGVLLVFFIVLMTNLVDKDSFNQLRQSVTTIFEDRIVASDILFEISMHVQKKELAIATSDTSFFQLKNSGVNQELTQLIGRYQETKLTEKERSLFDDLKTEIASLQAMESGSISASNQRKALARIDKITHTLHGLSKIQVKEGRKEMFVSNKAMNTIDLFTKGEIIFLIIMAILVQIIILYKPKESQS